MKMMMSHHWHGKTLMNQKNWTRDQRLLHLQVNAQAQPQAWLKRQLRNTSFLRRFVIDLSSLPPPLWQQAARRRMMGKQSAPDNMPAPSARRVVVSHKAAAGLAEWTAAEQAEIHAAPDWRQRDRVQKRLSHNRVAADAGRHVLAPFDSQAGTSVKVYEGNLRSRG